MNGGEDVWSISIPPPVGVDFHNKFRAGLSVEGYTFSGFAGGADSKMVTMVILNLAVVEPKDKEQQQEHMPPGTAEDDRVPPKTKNPYFLENYFGIFRNPPTPISLELMKSRKFFTNFEKNIEIRMHFHQNHCEKRRN